MAALQTLAVLQALSARLRLALCPHAASGGLVGAAHKKKTPLACALRGFSLPIQNLITAIYIANYQLLTGDRRLFFS
jgi:hypothetical protein